ncbi:hypothetical protein PHYSODRAFT_307911 [Phytophthora sojae]|uniref:Uncharacterized protein n=1 Tax=Phytophthora sojae (strain P6497) TaxID=1094619 RepID=G5AGV6_PHYSP|nr:hypothetical protein PHYSODRAFT_307911 [Phytophthora sojae]EGZ05149.1 hypothetical protein PHYSODRAFT_307911 [Phytophthora sojae]|eukprot:XP_009539307.1 hypothetical protein PHYSODRAFT_307911 [Phytophthora sojae]
MAEKWSHPLFKTKLQGPMDDTGTQQHTIAERIEFVVAVEKHNWRPEDAAKVFGIPRTTLLGYVDAKDDLFSTEADPWTRRVTRPGLPPPTEGSEAPVVALVRQGAVDECARVIPGMSNKSGSAQKSWLTRFIGRNKLADHVARYPKKSKTSRSDQDAKAAKRHKPWQVHVLDASCTDC